MPNFEQVSCFVGLLIYVHAPKVGHMEGKPPTSKGDGMTQQPVLGRTHDFGLADRLRAAREDAGYDQRAFAEATGISRGSISNYENGNTAPRKPIITAWALATGFDAHWLETGQQTGPSPDPNEGLPETTKNPRPQGPGDKDGGLPRLDSNQEPFGYWPRHHLADAA